jgi:hypothetical protein
MNRHLTESIIEHIFSHFVILSSTFVDVNKTRSLISPDFLLSEKLRFEIDGEMLSNKIWGCQITIGANEFKILLGDCGAMDEFAMIVYSNDLPTWGLYLACNDQSDFDKEAMIACSISSKEDSKSDSWMEASTFLQASFLAGMEQLKDSGLPWSKCSNYKEAHQKLVSFIKFHTNVYEDKNERQEEGL